MTTALVQPQNGHFLDPSIISSIVLKGDIGGLNQQEKVQYYNHICERLDLDPATQPFQLLNLSGKQVMYATKSAAEQLTRRFGISHAINDRQTINDVHIVYVRATEVKTGRYEDSSGAVAIAGLKGDALANALMKAETKAKRRSTLSLLGLGMLDETEVEIIPNAQPATLTLQPDPISLALSQRIAEDVDRKIGEPPPIYASDVIPQPPEEVRAFADEQFGPRPDGLHYENEILPFGKKSKGKMFKDIQPADLDSARKWILDKNVEKYYDLAKHIQDYLNASGLPF